MISRLRLSGFKSVNKEQELDFASLTVISGENSSGKSTALQALLVLAQSAMTFTSTRSAVLNGRFVRLGTTREVLNLDREEQTFSVGIDVAGKESGNRRSTPGRPYRPLRQRFAVQQACLNVSFQPSTRGDADTEAELSHVNIRGVLTTPDGQPDACDFTAHKSRISIGKRLAREGYNEEVLDALEQRSLMYTVKLDKKTKGELSEEAEVSRVDIRGATFNHFFPTAVAHRFAYAQVFPQRLINRLTGSYDHAEMDAFSATPQEWRSFLGEPLAATLDLPWNEELLTAQEVRESILLRTVPSRRKIREELRLRHEGNPENQLDIGPSESNLLELVDLPARLVRVMDELRQSLLSVRYVGPLRLQPSPVYPIATADRSDDVGIAGEQTAAVLERNSNKSVTYMTTASGGREFHTEPLTAAVARVLLSLQLVTRITVRDRGSLGHEVLVATPGSDVLAPISHVGVGVSQCLPIIVQCLVSRLGDVIVLEQPELHLHPAVQARLADFLLDMTQSGRQIIIESHSEHIISRLRRRIAEGLVAPEDVALYFAERQPATHYRRVSISSTGTPHEWPPGFFDQGQVESEAILKASISRLLKES